MPKTPAFHSINEEKKLAANRVYHDNSACPPGRNIPQNERRPQTTTGCGTTGTLTKQGR